jgi:hypothetical protein
MIDLYKHLEARKVMLFQKHLTKYAMPKVLEPSLGDAFEQACEMSTSSSLAVEARRALLEFKAFVDMRGTQLKVVGLERYLSTIISEFYGYKVVSSDYRIAYRIVNSFMKIIAQVCKTMGVAPIEPVKFSKVSLTPDMECCIAKFEKIKLNPDRVRYYEGWVVVCSDGKEQQWNLSFFHQQYGADLTQRLWVIVERSCKSMNINSVSQLHSATSNLITSLIDLYPTKEELLLAGSYERINDTVRTVFFRRLVETKINGQDIPYFYNKSWCGREIKVIERFFIGAGIWSDPPLSLWSPKFKVSNTVAGTNEVYDEQGNAFSKKLVTHIPLLSVMTRQSRRYLQVLRMISVALVEPVNDLLQ